MFYSKPGMGKTSLAAEFPNVVFLIGPNEGGINDLKSAGKVRADIPVGTASNWQETIELLDDLATKEHSYQFLALDSLSEFQSLLFKHVVTTLCGGSQDKFAAYGHGYALAVPLWEEMLRKLERLRQERGMGIILLAHSTITKFNDPQREAYDRIIVDLHDSPKASLLKPVEKFASDMGFIDARIELLEDKTNRQKAKGGRYRDIHFEATAVYDAKSRFGLTDPVSLGENSTQGYQNLIATMQRVRDQNTAAATSA